MNAFVPLQAQIKTQQQAADFKSHAHLQAIVGAAPKSIPFLLSGTRCWIAFFEKCLLKKGCPFPPIISDLMAWSTLFRSAGTFRNYLNYVKTACMIVGASTSVFDSSELRKARKAVDKRGEFTSRPKMWIQHEEVTKIVLCFYTFADEEQPEYPKFAMLFLLTYSFLLRLPSEALPSIRGNSGMASAGNHKAVLYRQDDDLFLKLSSRKNKPRERPCWCSQCSTTCPVHALWPFFEQLELGEKPFAGIAAGRAMQVLRSFMHSLGDRQHKLYRTHDLRRGHAKDLQMNGANLHEILTAWDGRSPAIFKYLDMFELEAGAVMEAHCDESSSEDEE